MIKSTQHEHHSSLQNALAISTYAAKLGFEWEQIDQVWEKVEEEINELKDAIKTGTKNEQEMELGDLLFSIANIGRFLDLSSENALKKTNQKFIQRFTYMETKVEQKNQSFSSLSLDEMEKLWEEAKTKEK